MSKENEKLLKWYYKGFHDELWGVSNIFPDSELEKRAYSIGAIHAVVGDDCTAIDYLSEEEILNEIHKK